MTTYGSEPVSDVSVLTRSVPHITLRSHSKRWFVVLSMSALDVIKQNQLPNNQKEIFLKYFQV